jgi:hypothetical protein
MNMIGIQELLLLQAMFLANIPEIITGNVLGPLGKSLWIFLLGWSF